MAHQLLTELQRLGIRLRLTDGRLEVLAPNGALTAELRERLRAQRDQLIGLLARGQTADASAPLEARPEQRHEPFPLTDIQHAYWVGRGSALELGGVSCHYYFELDGEGLDPDRLTASLRKVIDRHEMLRAIVRPDGRQQILLDIEPYEIAVADLRSAPAAEREATLARTRGEMDHQVRPAETWPLFEIRASRLPGDRVRLHVSLDVMILDGLSLHLLFDDWWRFYQDDTYAPEPLAVSYRDVVLHTEAERSGSRYAEDEKYWMDRLDSLPPAPNLPLAVQPSQLPRPTFTRRQARLPCERWTTIKRRAQEHGCTPSAVLLTAYAEVLGRWSAQRAFSLNLTLFNRPPLHPQINEVIGDFTTSTLLAVELATDASFAGRAAAVQGQLLRDLEHLSFSGVRVLRERGRRLGAGPGAAMPVVFTSALVLGGGDEAMPGASFFGEQVYGISQTPQLWLDHQVAEEAGELVLTWDAVEELFPAGVLDDMFAAYRRLIDQLADEPEAWSRPGDLVALPDWQAGERNQANATAADLPVRTLTDLVAEQAARRPDAPAVVAGDGTLTYRELTERAERLARRLAALGAARETLVAVVLDKGVDQAAAVVGVTRSGAAYLPIDPNWPAARIHHLLEQGGCRIVVTSDRRKAELPWPDGIVTVTPADDADGDLPPGPAPEDLAYVIFTSGSTGVPKGVAVEHRAAANTVQDINRRFAIGPDDRVLGVSALSFDLSVYDIFGILAAGGTLVLPAAGTGPDPQRWSELARRHGVTVWNSVPALMQAWLDSDAPGTDTLRLVLLSGDWIPVGLPAAARERHPGAKLVSLGGATEGSIWSIAFPIGEVPPEWVRIPYGRALANQSMHVLDSALQPCPVWTVGEIFIGGAGVARGYWADPERTAERFLTHPITGQRLYRTGDLGRFFPGGDIEFLGRADNQVKINGFRIELDEIAAALQRQPGVAAATAGVDTNPVTGRRQLVAHVLPDRSDGGSDDSVWATVVAAGESRLKHAHAELADELAGYERMWSGVAGLCPLVIARTLASAGFFRSAGETHSLDDIVTGSGSKPAYRALLGHWLSALVTDGRLERTPDGYRSVCDHDPDTLDEQIRTGFAALRPHGESETALTDYVRRCADRQTALLRGEVTPLELLLANGSQVTDALYATNPVSRLQNLIAAEVVRSFVAEQPSDRPVRVLEIGAGTGATTAAVLEAVPEGRVRYRFTDVSSYFTERARARFRRYPGVEYAVHNIDLPAADQGSAPAGTDVVIAANVLHDATDLGRTLRDLRSTLRAGGLLVAIEGTTNSLVQLITVGFIEGLARERTDDGLPLLSAEAWRSELAKAGFRSAVTVPDGPAAVEAHVQHVLVAAAPSDRAELDPAVLRASLAAELPEYLVPRHLLVIDRLPLTANGKVDRSALPTPGETSGGAELRSEPRDSLEEKLIEIWRDALERDDFGIEDNFFELGGDSLHAVTVLERLRSEFGLEARGEEGLEMLFDNPTIAELAASLRTRDEQ